MAEVVVDSLAFREEPSTDAAHVEGFESLEVGAAIFIVEGPVHVDAHDWYRVAASRVGGPDVSWREAGWIAAGRTDGSEGGNIAPMDTECPEEPVGVTELMEFDQMGAAGLTSSLERLVCFGDRELVFRAWITETTGMGGDCRCEVSPHWLAHPHRLAVALDDEETDYMFDGDGDWFSAYTNPDAGVEHPALHQWVEVTGHFDDPASETCEWSAEEDDLNPPPSTPDPALVILDCRVRFVATSFEPVSGP